MSTDFVATNEFEINGRTYEPGDGFDPPAGWQIDEETLADERWWDRPSASTATPFLQEWEEQLQDLQGNTETHSRTRRTILPVVERPSE